MHPPHVANVVLVTCYDIIRWQYIKESLDYSLSDNNIRKKIKLKQNYYISLPLIIWTLIS